MKLSALSYDQIKALSDEVVQRIVYDRPEDDAHADVALLLGTSPDFAEARACKAAELYFAGRCKHIIPTGGVAWEVNGKSVSEARLMADILLARGVPAEAIIMEEEATTTKENMIFGTLQITRRLNIRNVHSCVIVTSSSHLRRSLALAKLLLPRSVKILGAATRERDGRARELCEVQYMHDLIFHGLIEDIEYAAPTDK